MKKPGLTLTHEWSWGERPYDQLQHLVRDWFKGEGFSVLVLSWKQPPHFIVARDGVTAFVAAKPIGYYRVSHDKKLATFCGEWDGHVFTVATKEDCARAAYRMAQMAELQNRVPASVAAGTQPASSPAS